MTADNWPEEIERIAAAYPDNQDMQLLVARLREVTRMLELEGDALTFAYQQLSWCYRDLHMPDLEKLYREGHDARKAAK